MDTRFVDLIRARRGRRPRKCLAGKLVDLIIARKCRRPRKCQAGKQARPAREAKQVGRQARQPRPGQAGLQAGRQAGQAWTTIMDASR